MGKQLDVFSQLYLVYETKGAEDIQKRIDRLQDIDGTELFKAEEGWRLKLKETIFTPDPNFEFPDFSDVDIDE